MIPVIKSKLFRTIFALFMLFFGTAKAQPIPIELIMGTNMVQLISPSAKNSHHLRGLDSLT